MLKRKFPQKITFPQHSDQNHHQKFKKLRFPNAQTKKLTKTQKITFPRHSGQNRHKKNSLTLRLQL